MLEANIDHGRVSELLEKRIVTEEHLPELYTLYNTVLHEGIEAFPANNEFIFWKYFSDNHYEAIEREELVKIIEMDESSLVPYYYLYLVDVSNGIPVTYMDKIHALTESISGIRTRKKHLYSVIN